MMADLFQMLSDKANAEILDLRQSMVAGACGLPPVPGSGNALADIFFVKPRPDLDEESAGVAFAGASGEAVLKAAERLGIPVGVLYGTNLTKCRRDDPGCASACRDFFEMELRIVQPRLVFAMGEPAFSAAAESLGYPVSYQPGTLQRRVGLPALIGSVELATAPADEAAKKQLWRDLKVLGAEYLPA